ncbi:MAG TPA: transposase, partial [Ignavibacteria bacterium]|nr:transposase [Ignavibacteria bacterium]
MKKQRKVRIAFSTAFKREKVELIDQGQLTVKELSLIYQVSDRAIYNWIKKFSKYSSTERIVVEKIS